MNIGQKFQFKKSLDWGVGEIVASSEDVLILRFYISPFQTHELEVEEEDLSNKKIPEQSTCFWFEGDNIIWGRVDKCLSEAAFPRQYFVKPASCDLCQMGEDEFHLRAYRHHPEVMELLGNVETETPYFFANRDSLLRCMAEQRKLSRGMEALAGSRVELYNHQLQAAERVLKDHRVRFLLADEVGLGKTIETGLIIKQLLADDGLMTAQIFVPETLVEQWEEEMRDRFQFPGKKVGIKSHASLSESVSASLVIIDEAHRLRKEDLFNQAKSACSQASCVLLLTATPVVRSSSDLFWLLHLLEPEIYSESEEEAFMERFTRRREIGKFLRSLQAAQTDFPIRMTINRVPQILPQDSMAAGIALKADGLEGADLKKVQHELLDHVSETYRIHRRMLRTRRKWIVEDVRHAIRSERLDLIEDIVINDQENLELWDHLETWRLELNMNKLEAVHDDLLDLYFDIATAIAGTNHQLDRALKRAESHRVCQSTGVRNAIDAMRLSASNRSYEPYEDTVLDMLKQASGDTKFVLFCSSDQARESLLHRIEEEALGVEAFGMDDCESYKDVIDDFKDAVGVSVLLCDSRAEEGLNLQFAHRFIHFDMPFDPMRIEQRIGRVDRIVHKEKFSTRMILSSEDEELPVDWAWFCVLKEGFGIFEESVSDIPFLLNEIREEFRSFIFENGPTAVDADYLDGIQERVRVRREENEDQDIVDGLLSIDSQSSDSIMASFRQLDEESEEFKSSLGKFAHSHLKLKFQPLTQHYGEGAFSFHRRHPDAEVLIDASRTTDLLAHLASPLTVDRELACSNFELDFLRPGSSTIDQINGLLSWDIRGQAFAMWRACERFEDPEPVFRILLKVHPQISPDASKAGFLDHNLFRMAEGFFPPFLQEVLIDKAGAELDEELSYLCRQDYNDRFIRRISTNLGGRRRGILLSRFGKKEWSELCKASARKAIEITRNHEAFGDALFAAKERMETYFTREEARTRIQQDSDFFSQELLDMQVSELNELKRILEKSITEPRVSIEIAGAYVLCREPFWKVEDESD